MSHISPQRLIQLVCDEQATAEQCAALEALVLGDASVRRAYVDTMNVHAALLWDQIESGTEAPPVPTPRRSPVRVAVAALAAVAAAVAVMLLLTPAGVEQPIAGDRPITVPVADDPVPVEVAPPVPVLLAETPPAPRPEQPKAEAVKPQPFDLAASVARIDDAIATRLQEEQVAPSPRAAPGQWLRRASLDLRGRIPVSDEIDAFLAADPATRRGDYVAASVASTEFAQHMATRWSTLLVGRSDEMQTYRARLRGWLTEQFASGQPWRKTAGELIAARGPESHPPTNFLLAHLNNQAVPATAYTSRVLLGRQVQCTQCHRHPWNDQSQDAFWQLNAFFKQTKIRSAMKDGRRVRELVDTDDGGPVYYEDLAGVMQVAYPAWNGREVSRENGVARREALAELIATDNDPALAEAMASRVWEQLIGAPLTPKVDDLGPHVAVSHPEVLAELRDAFLASDYDLAALVTLVASTEVYQRSSEPAAADSADRPETGSPALLSRVYVKPLSAEQIYDSIVVAARGLRGSRAGLPDRDEWTARFYQTQQNEENADMTTFDGSISQALALMNGQLVQAAVASSDALDDVLSAPGTQQAKLAAVLELALGRPATEDEADAIARVLRPAVRRYAKSQPGPEALKAGLRDVFWACLNSGPFAMNY